MRVLITGGLGFIGINTAIRFAEDGHEVTLFDNLSKPGSRENTSVAASNNCNVIIGDLKEYAEISRAVTRSVPDIVFHLGAQTAVTHSIDDPWLDFDSNALGTFNLLEACREVAIPEVKVIYASTNKVYGALEHIKLVETDMSYEFDGERNGIDELERLDFYSPYGCSKGCADQYVRDYARIYDMDTCVVRQSCVYGKYQDGTEDQGWVAWFAKAFLEDIPITLYGDGKQVRDILYIDDLIDFYYRLTKQDNKGEIYNIGGGADNTVSLLELIDMLKDMTGKSVDVSYADERPGDQKIFVSDNTKAHSLMGWRPKVGVKKGLEKLIVFLKDGEV